MIRRPPRSTLFPYTNALPISPPADPRAWPPVYTHRPASAVAQSPGPTPRPPRSEEHTSELQSQSNLVCRLLLEKKKKKRIKTHAPEYTRTKFKRTYSSHTGLS